MNAQVQAKMAMQRNEIARLTQLVAKLMKHRDLLTDELKWIRGQK